MDAVRMVLLTTAPSSFAAQVLVARLGAEGILWELRGQSSVYPVGTVDVLVEEPALFRARELVVPADDPGQAPPLGAVAGALERPFRTVLALTALVVLTGMGLRLLAWLWV